MGPESDSKEIVLTVGRPASRSRVGSFVSKLPWRTLIQKKWFLESSIPPTILAVKIRGSSSWDTVDGRSKSEFGWLLRWNGLDLAARISSTVLVVHLARVDVSSTAT